MNWNKTSNTQPKSCNLCPATACDPFLAALFISPGPQTGDPAEPLTFLHFSASLSQAHMNRLSFSTPAASGKDSATLLLYYYTPL